MSQDINLLDRAKAWIYKNVPAHSRAVYEELLMHNERLMLKLIAKCMAYDDLLEAHFKLEKEVYDRAPSPCWQINAHVDRDVMMRRTITTVNFTMDPIRARVAIDEYEAARYGSEPIMQAISNHFDREIAPRLRNEMMHCLADVAQRAA